MPEDPNRSINQSFKQSAHAQEQKMLRKVMDDNGVTRSQARQVLHSGGFGGAGNGQRAPQPRVHNRQVPPEIKRNNQELPQRKMAVGGDAPVIAPAPAAALPTTQASLVVIDGVLYLADVYMKTPVVV